MGSSVYGRIRVKIRNRKDFFMLEELFFHTGPALKFIFKLGIEPKDEYFFEFTEEDYNKLKTQGEDVEETMYMFIPDTVSYTHLRAHETDSYLVCRLLLEK